MRPGRGGPGGSAGRPCGRRGCGPLRSLNSVFFRSKQSLLALAPPPRVERAEPPLAVGRQARRKQTRGEEADFSGLRRLGAPQRVQAGVTSHQVPGGRSIAATESKAGQQGGRRDAACSAETRKGALPSTRTALRGPQAVKATGTRELRSWALTGDLLAGHRVGKQEQMT